MWDTCLWCLGISTSSLLSCCCSSSSSNNDSNESTPDSMNIDGALEPRRIYLRLDVGDCRGLSLGTVRISIGLEPPGLNLIEFVACLGICFGPGVATRKDGLKMVMIKIGNFGSLRYVGPFFRLMRSEQSSGTIESLNCEGHLKCKKSRSEVVLRHKTGSFGFIATFYTTDTFCRVVNGVARYVGVHQKPAGKALYRIPIHEKYASSLTRRLALPIQCEWSVS